jgi:hypothetical protein
METIPLQKPNYKTPETDKDYFAAYLNMARHNAFIALSAINKRIYPDNDSNFESRLSQMPVILDLEDPSKPEQVLKIQNYLDKRFPFLKPVFSNEQYRKSKDKENPDLSKDYKEVLTLFFDHLNNLRNYYSHVDHEQVKIEEKLPRFLAFIYDASLLTAKKNNHYTDAETKHLEPILYKRKGREVEKVINPDFRYPLREDNQLSAEGLAFFICLFLEKQYISELLGKLKNFKNRSERCYRATIDTYKTFSIDVPFDRIESTQPKMAVALDMLNDLKRCPKPLWDTLSPEDQLKFKVAVEDANEEDPDSLTHADLLLQKRYHNRFPLFALNYIDQMNAFQSLRFQVYMGPYFYKFYDKNLIDGVSRQRNISVPLKAFGKINELDIKRKIDWENLLISNPPEDYNKPYVKDTFPHYNITNHQIGIYDTHGEEVWLPTPNGIDTALKQPDAWLSEYELPGLVFYVYLTRKNNSEWAESLIKDYVANVRLLFDDIISGSLTASGNINDAQKVLDKYNLELVNLPDELRNFFVGNTINRTEKFGEHAHRMIELLLHQTQRYLEGIEHKIAIVKGKGNKIGKKKYKEIRSGELADFLAKDFLKFQPSYSVNKDGNKDGKDKITSANYQALQAHLAFYGRDYKKMASYFEQCGLTKGSNQHPFLSLIDPSFHSDILSFYIAYLKERKNYLFKCSKEREYSTYYFLKPYKLCWQANNNFYIDLVKRYRKLPINLPRGLFLDALIKWFRNNGSESMKALVTTNQRVNTIFLLQKYIEYEMYDGSQEFYYFGRSYKCADKLAGKYAGNKLQRIFLSNAECAKNMGIWKNQIALLPAKPLKVEPFDTRMYKEPMLKLWNEFIDNEKVVRLVKAQDILQFLLAREILLSEKVPELAFANTNSAFKLAGINAYAEQGTLSVLVSCELKVLNKTITHKLKIKNYGDFVRYTRDRRLKSLFSYPVPDIMELDQLKRELKLYDDARLEVSFHIQQFEKAMFEKLKPEILAEKENKKGYDYTDFKEIHDAFVKKFPFLKSESNELKNIRNSFMHNEYPIPHNIKTASGVFPGISVQISERAKQLVQICIATLKQL